MKNSAKAEDIALIMARYMAAELPVPGHLYDDLMAEVCANYKKEREGSKPVESQGTLGKVQ